MDRQLPVFLLCLFTNVSFACVTDQSVLPEVDDCRRNFSSIEAAVRNAAFQYREYSTQEDREYMGGILQQDAAFYYSVGKGKRGQDRITVRIKVPQGARLVALWHTHGAQHWSRRYFSEIDTELVERLRLPLYLADPAGDLHVFRPGDPTLSRRQSQRMGLGWGDGYAKGTRLAARETRSRSPSGLADRDVD